MKKTPEANASRVFRFTIFGATFDESLDDEIRVTVIATGFDKAPGQLPNKMAEEAEKAGEEAGGPAHAHVGEARVFHNGGDVGKVQVDVARIPDQIGNGLHRLAEHVVGNLKGVGKGNFLVHKMAEEAEKAGEEVPAGPEPLGEEDVPKPEVPEDDPFEDIFKIFNKRD